MKYYITKAQSGVSLVKPGLAKVSNNITISKDGKSFTYDKGWNRRFWYTPDGKLAYVKIDPLNSNVDFGKVTEIDPTDMNAIDELFGKEYYHDGQANKNRQAVLDWLNPQIVARNARNNYSASEIVNGRPNAEVDPTQNRVTSNGNRIMAFDERPATKTTTQVSPGSETSRREDPALTLRQKQDAYNRGRIDGGTEEAIRRQELLRSKNYNIAADGYWGAKSEEAWRQYQAVEQAAAEQARLLGLSNGELMKLNADQIKYGDAETQDRYNRLMEAQAALQKSLTFGGVTYENADAYNAAVNQANLQAQAARSKQYWTDMGTYADNLENQAKINALSGKPGWMRADGKKAQRYYNVAQRAMESENPEAFGQTLTGRDKRIYNRMMKRTNAQDWNINKPKAEDYIAEVQQGYVAPTGLREIDMNATTFNKKGGCLYKKGKRVK